MAHTGEGGGCKGSTTWLLMGLGRGEGAGVNGHGMVGNTGGRGVGCATVERAARRGDGSVGFMASTSAQH